MGLEDLFAPLAPITNPFEEAGQELSNFWGEISGSNAAEEAAEAQTQAAQRANEMAKEIFLMQREDIAPFREVGLSALSGLEDPGLGVDISSLEQDPGYQFRLGEGLRAVNAGASAGGRALGGANQKALMRYGQGLASQEYGDAYNREFNRLSQLAGIGSGSNVQMVGAAGQYGQNVSSNLIGAANAQAAARMGQSQNFSNLIGQGMTAAGMYAASDKRLKKDIRKVDKKDLKELLSTIKPYIFKYKDKAFGVGDHIGVMAQDLEKSKIGKMAVFENEKGEKFVNFGRLIPSIVAALGEGAA